MFSTIVDKVKQFLKETIEAEAIKIVRIDNVDHDWIVEAEVAEKNQYLASIKPEYRVFDKERYIVKLNSDLEVASYKRIKSGEEEQEHAGYDF
jgi:hypothetical protein